MARKIKIKAHKPRVHGHRQNNSIQAWERGAMQRILQGETRRRRMTRVDEVTGETYILARLALVGKKDDPANADEHGKGAVVEEYRAGLAEALAGAEGAGAQAEAIRSYLQRLVEEKRLTPIECKPGEKPVCRIYKGEKARIVVIMQDGHEEGGAR